jgi:hypothetical protein
VVGCAFALFHLWGAALAVRAQNWPFAAFYLLLGVAGFAVSLGLLRMYRRVRTEVRRRHD